jgi:phage baseplate assembly protein gpV
MRRASSQIDFAAMGRVLARPGMDPRSWCSLAIVQSVVVDEAEGVFCDVLLMPSKRRETARLGAAYAGSGWGLYAPPMVDDEVLVSAPSGDPALGLVITSRLWSPADVPPADAATHPEDVLLTVRPDKSLRLVVSGGGKVVLGTADASRGVARLDDQVNIGTKTVTVQVLVPSPPSGTVPTVITDVGGTVISTTVLPWSGVPPIPPSVTTLYGSISQASETVVSA